MKIIPEPIIRILKKFFPLLLIIILVWMGGCSSSGRIGKGKPGQVPCPCEKGNKRR